jgi:predicted DNA-binding ribbon-helix-helix protein
MNAIRKRSLIIAGHRTSVSLEEPFWEELSLIAAAKGKSISALVGEIDRSRKGNLSSAIRLLVLEELRRNLELKSQDTKATLPS